MGSIMLGSFEQFENCISCKYNKSLGELTKEEMLQEFYVFYKWAVNTINSERHTADFVLEVMGAKG